MSEIKVPTLPESIDSAIVAKWHVQPGQAVHAGENIVDLETDKIMLEVPAPEDGKIGELLQEEGAEVKSEESLVKFTPGAVPKKKEEVPQAQKVETQVAAKAVSGDQAAVTAGPAARRVAASHQVDLAKVAGSGKAGRVTAVDVRNQIQKGSGQRQEQRVPMSRLRTKIAERLLSAQQSAAILTTFNEVDMQAVMDLRARYRDQFETTHQVRLGFMSFFIKAAVKALQQFPDVNASIDGSDMIYHSYFDIGIAVSTPRGLVVPILRDADELSVADTEKAVRSYASLARDGKLELDDLRGGTFTITNGGTFGSMLSTPILNLPQSAILGMHNIVKRAVVVNDQVVIRPMMYLALSYDHRIIDGSTSVRFLVTIKEMLEDPMRLLLDV
jgi:2-oxoglutarate dehydrogenase E2 component (dihydrolipoamide succinyltransferase)